MYRDCNCITNWSSHPGAGCHLDASEKRSLVPSAPRAVGLSWMTVSWDHPYYCLVLVGSVDWEVTEFTTMVAKTSFHPLFLLGLAKTCWIVYGYAIPTESCNWLHGLTVGHVQIYCSWVQTPARVFHILFCLSLCAYPVPKMAVKQKHYPQLVDHLFV